MGGRKKTYYGVVCTQLHFESDRGLWFIVFGLWFFQFEQAVIIVNILFTELKTINYKP